MREVGNHSYHCCPYPIVPPTATGINFLVGGKRKGREVGGNDDLAGGQCTDMRRSSME